MSDYIGQKSALSSKIKVSEMEKSPQEKINGRLMPNRTIKSDESMQFQKIADKTKKNTIDKGKVVMKKLQLRSV